MSNQKNSKKTLLFGILGTVVVLAAVLGLMLMGCTPKQGASTAPTSSGAEHAAEYQLYWNLDRAEYDGKSEAGMSSRMPESDGYFHIRMFRDGEELVLKTSDRKVINKLDTMSLCGLEFDEDGLISGVLDIDELPLETPGWSFYVQSVGGKTIKLNSSETMVGMELLLEGDENTGIYDMTGMSGKVGCEAEPMTYDRVYPVVDLNGNLTHMFIYSRPNFMLTHEGECQHCKEKVTWYEWTRTDTLPSKTGHYQLMADPVDVTQVSYAADVKICLDLNGHVVNGKKDARIISLHNPGTSLAIMDTSEAQTGRMVGHSVASPQGGVVWVRYGQFHLYSGTLDGSDMISRLNGTVVQIQKNAFFYMYGGEIIGGTAAPQKGTTAGKYTHGLGGSVQSSGTMRMYGGVIRDGKAPAAYYYNKGKLTLARGMGGNLFLSSGSVTEIAGGKILNGFAGNVGANIMMDGTAELTISGGEIAGGRTEGRVAGKNGANIYCGGKGKIVMTGGKIADGRAVNGGGGNIFLQGTMIMSSATISGGYAGYRGGNILMSSKASLRLEPGAVIMGGKCDGNAAGHGGGNIALISDDSRLEMIGGAIRDGVAKSTVGEDGVRLGGDGGNININKGTVILRGGVVTNGKAEGNGDGIYVGWNSQMLRLEQNIQIFDNGDTDIVRSANTAKAKSNIIIGSWKGNAAKRNTPVVERINGTTGMVVATSEDGSVLEAEKMVSANPVLPLEADDKGNIVLGKAYLGEADHTHCLCAGKFTGHSCSDTGFVTVTADIFDKCWAAGSTSSALAGSLNICLSEDVTIDSEYVVAGNELNLCLHGHTIHMTDNARITANGTTGVLNITDCTGKGKILAADNCRASFLYTYKGIMSIYGGTVDGSKLGEGLGAVRVGYAGDTFNLYGGTVIGSKNAKHGGGICCDTASTVNIYGGTVRDGVATVAGGGNIFLNHNDAVLNIFGGTISGGKATATAVGSGLGGNIHVIKGKLNISGGTITGGVSKGKTGETEPAGVTGGVYAAYNAGAFKLSGNAKITGNTGSDIWLTSKASYVVTLNGWNGNGGDPLVIGKTGAAVGTQLVSGAEREDLTKFASYFDAWVLKHTGGKIILATPFVHDHCICAGKVEGHSCQTVSFVEVANKTEWDALFDSNKLLKESISVALNGDFALNAEYKLGGHTMDLCLNGKTLTMSGSGRITANGTTGVLNITDCGNGGIVAASGTTQGFLYTYEGNINLYSGTLDASAIQQTTGSSGGKSGGIFIIYNASDRVTMYGGKLIGATIYRGGSVYVYKGTFDMRGGLITGGHAGVGGGVATDYGTFIMAGGTITGNTAVTNGAGVFLGHNSSTTLTLSGSAAIYGNEGPEDVYCGQKASYNVNHLILDSWNGKGTTPMCVGTRDAAEGKVVVMAKTGQLDAAVLKNFTYPGEELRMLLSEGKVVLAGYHRHCICAGELEGHSCTEVKFMDIATAEEFAALFENNVLKASASIVLTGSFTLDHEYTVGGHTLSICLNGNTITMAGSGRITSNGTTGVLNITDCGNGGIVAAEGAATSFLFTHKGKLNIYGGTVDATKTAAAAGGAIRVNQPGDEFNLYGGTIIGSKKGTSGGTIYMTNTGTINIHGGMVKDGVATTNGGNICLAKGVLNVFGGTITGGSGTLGGNIQSNADDVVVNISGGIISGGTASGVGTATGLGGNIHMVRGTLNISGGTITGGTANGAPDDNNPVGTTGGIYLAYNVKPFTLSGNAKIYGNNGADIWLSSKASYVINLDGWAGNGNNDALVVGRNAGADGSLIASGKTALTTADLAKFASYYEELKLALNADGKIVLEEIIYHEHCLCNGKYTGAGHSCKDVRFEEIANTDEFLALFDENRYLKSSVSIYLTGDVELSVEYWTNGNTLSICLNGHTINMKSGGKLTSNKTTGVLNITDCGNGKIVAASGTTQSFLYTYNGTLNLYGGTVDGSAIVQTTASSGGKSGGVINVYQPNDQFNMYGGKLIGATIYRGGSVYAYKGTFNMYGGLITGGHAGVGGGVATDYGTFNMFGGTITGNTAVTNGAGVFLGFNSTTTLTLSGNAAIYGNTGCEDIRLGQKSNDHKRIVLDGWTGCGTGKTMVISSATEADAAVIAEAKTGAVTEAQLAFLAYQNNDYTLVLNAEGKVALKKLHKHCICDGDAKNEEGHTCSTLTYAEVATLEQFQSYFALTDGKYMLQSSQNLVLTGSFTLDKEYAMNGNTMNLCLNGQTITMSGNGRITANGTSGVLNISDCGNGKIAAAEGTTPGFIYLYNGNVNLFGGTIDASKLSTTANGGAVYVNTDGNVFTMFGGVVKAAKKANYGGAVYLDNGDIVIRGGTIYGGEAARGGAVFAQNKLATFTMHGGTINGGSAELGGGVCCNYAKFIMTGGLITGGTASSTGAGVNIQYNVSEPPEISGTAKITGNNGADIHLGQNIKKYAQTLVVDPSWSGNGEKALIISKNDASNGAVLVTAKTGSLTEAILSNFQYLTTDYTLAVSNGKVVLAK